MIVRPSVKILLVLMAALLCTIIACVSFVILGLQTSRVRRRKDINPPYYQDVASGAQPRGKSALRHGQDHKSAGSTTFLDENEISEQSKEHKNMWEKEKYDKLWSGKKQKHSWQKQNYYNQEIWSTNDSSEQATNKIKYEWNVTNSYSSHLDTLLDLWNYTDVLENNITASSPTAPSPTMPPTSSSPTVSPTSSPTASPTEKGPIQHAFQHFSNFRAEHGEVTFYAIGDAPYNRRDERILREQLVSLPSDAEFVIHVGDVMKRIKTNCTLDAYLTARRVLRKSPVPLFLLPGDNDYTDCPDPILSWHRWKRYLNRFDEYFYGLSSYRFNVNRQFRRDENFSFFHNGVLFFEINHVKGPDDVKKTDVHWQRRDRANAYWARQNLFWYSEARAIVVFTHAQGINEHSEFFKPFLEAADTVGKPILLIHGNGHKYDEEYNFQGRPNIRRVQLDFARIAYPTKITVGMSSMDPFSITRRCLSEENPDCRSLYYNLTECYDTC